MCSSALEQETDSVSRSEKSRVSSNRSRVRKKPRKLSGIDSLREKNFFSGSGALSSAISFVFFSEYFKKINNCRTVFQSFLYFPAFLSGLAARNRDEFSGVPSLEPSICLSILFVKERTFFIMVAGTACVCPIFEFAITFTPTLPGVSSVAPSRFFAWFLKAVRAYSALTADHKSKNGKAAMHTTFSYEKQ